MMKQLYIICEGKTEVHLINNVFYDRLSRTYVNVIPITLPTGKNKDGGTAKGGFRRTNGYAYALKHIQNSIKRYRNGVFTTFFDLFRFPSDIGCYFDAKRENDPIVRAKIYERQMELDIRKELGETIAFIPYVQPCESEAFLFIDPLISAMEMGDSDNMVDNYKKSIEEIRDRYQTPEHINFTKGPSKYLEDILPSYRKNKVGRGGFSWRAAREIGINAICDKCEHFEEWVLKLESL